jgi:Zn-dependent M16 (insulinase) family peptidase
LATATCISSMQHPDAAAIKTTIAWLNMLEGHLWKRIRGAGLAYGANIHSDILRGQIFFKVYRSPNGFLAWNEAKKIIDEISSGAVLFHMRPGLMD